MKTLFQAFSFTFNLYRYVKVVKQFTYKPKLQGDACRQSPTDMYLGFAEEAPRTSIQGFCIYWKNRLIMPYHRPYHKNWSEGRGGIGVLETHSMQVAHDKQGFAKTDLKDRLEKSLKNYATQYFKVWHPLNPSFLSAQLKKNTLKAPSVSATVVHIDSYIPCE